MKDPCGGSSIIAAPKSPHFTISQVALPAPTTAPAPAPATTGIFVFAYTRVCMCIKNANFFLSSFYPKNFIICPGELKVGQICLCCIKSLRTGFTTVQLQKKVTDDWGGSSYLRVVKSFAWCNSWRDMIMMSSINFLTLTSKPNLTGEGGGRQKSTQKGRAR